MKKKNRVRKSKEFQELIHTGKKKSNASFVLYRKNKAETEARVGITLSKKIGHAVDRNKIKRQVRMMCRELIDFENFPSDIILIIRFGYKSLSYEENKKNLEKLLAKSTMI
ncbi:MAG: ribonuclease P protein component [Solobacterium sp.]|nr:ribonuclease P protein component [Solobacterium sp.]